MLVPPPPPQDFNDGIEAMEGCYFDLCCFEDYLTTPFHVKDIWVHTIVIGSSRIVLIYVGRLWFLFCCSGRSRGDSLHFGELSRR